MCGRFAFFSPSEAVSQFFGVDDPPALAPRYNIAPTQYAPVVRADEQDHRCIDMLRWGLVPFWAKDRKIGNRMINARSETVAEKPAYRHSFKRKRCLVPANGFFEWKKQGTVKQPYFISLGGEQPFAMAGLWASWKSKEDEDSEVLETFTIITTTASPGVATLHDRMPVILHNRDYSDWLSSAEVPADTLLTLLQPFDSDELTVWPVSRMVNNPRNDDASLVVADTLV